jgi:serine/threonine protein kinase
MPEAEAPVVWGDFEVRFDRLLGRGGMGSVYEARQVSLDRTVAVKVLDTDRAPTEPLAEGFLEKFQHEARALAKLNDPRIVTILQAGRTDGKCWYAMELVEGETVDQRISDKGALESREAARVAAEVARALSAALAQGIIHRDVKPANIFLTPDGRVKLGDFGLARSGGFKPTRFTEMNAVAGTPEYASPEQAANGTCDHRSDQYSLGAVLFEMVTERPPFGGANALETFFKHAHEPPPLPTRLNPEIPPALEAVILRCLEKDPARRYPNYDELIRDLEALRVEPADAAPEPSRGSERPTLAIRTAIVAAVVLLGFSIWGASRIFSKGPDIAPRKEPAPVVKIKEEPPPPLPPPPPAPAPEVESPKPPPEPTPAEALKAAWEACDRGDEAALAAYLATTPVAALEDELAGIRDPFAHPKSKAFERAIAELYRARGHEAESLGELRAWKGYPDSTKAKWELNANGLQVRDKLDETWLAREFPVGRGFTLTFRFAPAGAASWAGVAVSPMSEKSFRLLHVVQGEGGIVASLVERAKDKVNARGEKPMAARESHEFAVVERQGKFACFVDGHFLGWEDGPGPGARISIGVNRGVIDVTEVRISR